MEVVVVMKIVVVLLLLLRPPDHSRKAFMFSLYPFFLFFWQADSILPDGREMLRQNYTRNLIVGQTRKIHSDILPISP